MSDSDALAELTLPSEDACDEVRKWPPSRRARESLLLDAILRVRDTGGACPDTQHFVAGEPLELQGALVCAARNLAVDLEQTDNFGHGDADASNVVGRLAEAGWDTLLATELIAAADIAPERVVDEIWLTSAPHCDALRAASWTHVGIGYIENPLPAVPDPEAPTMWGAYWVVVLSTAER